MLAVVPVIVALSWWLLVEQWGLAGLPVFGLVAALYGWWLWSRLIRSRSAYQVMSGHEKRRTRDQFIHALVPVVAVILYFQVERVLGSAVVLVLGFMVVLYGWWLWSRLIQDPEDEPG